MVSAVIKSSITGLLVFAFCTAGIVKITDKMAPEVHKQMVRLSDFIIFLLNGSTWLKQEALLRKRCCGRKCFPV